MNTIKKKPTMKEYVVPLFLVFFCLFFYPSQNQDIHLRDQLTLNDAKKYVHNYFASHAVATFEDGYFSRETCDRILSQSNCVGIRYYPGKLDNERPAIIAVGVDEDGKDIANGIICIGKIDSLEGSAATHVLEH